MMNRREAMLRLGMAGAVAGLAPSRLLQAQTPPAASGPFTLPPLPYAADALEPYIDSQTMTIHHDRHHAAYVNNLNAAVAKAPGMAGKSVEDILRNINSVPSEVRTAIQNNGGGHSNHSLFWQMMKKNENGKPGTELAKAIDKSFGSYEKFQEQFTNAATTRFGSGWAWLVATPQKNLKIYSSANQDSPYMQGEVPVLGLDVWEHAYYLKYQNKRPDYIKAFYNVINWDFCADRFNKVG